MNNIPFSLPLQYTQLSKYYDPLSAGDLEGKNHVIETILKQHNVRTVLDLTCGTGSQVFYLAQQGYEVTGSDFSPALLNIAKEKAQKEHIDVTLLEGDMRTIQVGQFDAVITIFNAIGHLTKPDFEQALQNIHQNLKAGGIYVFDIFNLAAMEGKTVDDLAMDWTKTVGDTTIHNIQHSKINKETGQLTSYDTFTLQEGANEPQTIKGQFTLQLYTAKELRQILTRNGFSTLTQTALDGSTFSETTSAEILTVAKKD